MDSLQIKAAIAGLFFGIWPLLMNRSGLNGNVSSMAFAAIVLACVSPFTLSSMGNLANIKWIMVVGAGITGAIGLLAFNSMLAKSTPQSVGALFVIMKSGVSNTKTLGFALATVAATLLARP